MKKEKRDAFFDLICLTMSGSVLLLFFWFNIYLRLTGRLKVNYVLLKSYGLFVSLTFTATISFYHYPACLI